MNCPYEVQKGRVCRSPESAGIDDGIRAESRTVSCRLAREDSPQQWLSKAQDVTGCIYVLPYDWTRQGPWSQIHRCYNVGYENIQMGQTKFNERSLHSVNINSGAGRIQHVKPEKRNPTSSRHEPNRKTRRAPQCFHPVNAINPIQPRRHVPQTP
jgi:hypothetical protein